MRLRAVRTQLNALNIGCRAQRAKSSVVSSQVVQPVWRVQQDDVQRLLGSKILRGPGFGCLSEPGVARLCNQDVNRLCNARMGQRAGDLGRRESGVVCEI